MQHPIVPSLAAYEKKKWSKTLDKHVFLGVILLIEFIYVSPNICNADLSQYGQKKVKRWLEPLDKHVFLGALLLIEFICFTWHLYCKLKPVWQKKKWTSD